MNLGDLFTTAKGKKPPEVIDTPGRDAVRLLQIEDLRPGAIARYCRHTDSEVLCEDGDIVIAWDGAHSGIVGSGLHGVCGSTLARLRPTTGITHTPFVVRYLESQLDNIRRNRTGATIPHVNGAHLRSIEIPLPPLPAQKRIAAILDAADALRAKRRESIEQLDWLVQATFLSMFGYACPSKTIADMLESGVLVLHKDGNHGSLYPRADDFGEEGIPFLSAKSVSDSGELVHAEVQFLNQSKARKLRLGWLKAGDVLLAHNASVGKTHLYRGNYPEALIGTSLTAFRPDPSRITSSFLYGALRAAAFQQQLHAVMGQTTRNQVPITAQRRLSLPMPPLDLQTRFASIVESIEHQKARLNAHLAELDTLFASLQSRAFNGELVA
jgi:type I restriction enzyme S subunit